MLHRREVMVCAPTGSGKTLSFVLPLIQHLLITKKSTSFRALIVCPTRELAIQIHKICNNLITPLKDIKTKKSKLSSLKIQLLDKEAVKGFKRKGMKHGKGWDLLISTPNSIAYLLNSQPSFIRYVFYQSVLYIKLTDHLR